MGQNVHVTDHRKLMKYHCVHVIDHDAHVTIHQYILQSQIIDFFLQVICDMSLCINQILMFIDHKSHVTSFCLMVTCHRSSCICSQITCQVTLGTCPRTMCIGQNAHIIDNKELLTYHRVHVTKQYAQVMVHLCVIQLRVIDFFSQVIDYMS